MTLNFVNLEREENGEGGEQENPPVTLPHIRESRRRAISSPCFSTATTSYLSRFIFFPTLCQRKKEKQSCWPLGAKFTIYFIFDAHFTLNSNDVLNLNFLFRDWKNVIF